MQAWFKQKSNLFLILILAVAVIVIVVAGYTWFRISPNNSRIVVDYNSCLEAKGKLDDQIPKQCEYAGKRYLKSQSDKPEQEALDLDLPEAEKSQIEAWLEKNGYNQYGDKPDTVYTGGTPLFNQSTGQYTKLYDYLLQKYPDKPWLSQPRDSSRPEQDEEVQSYDQVKAWKSLQDPNFQLEYPDFVDLANQNGYPARLYNQDGFEMIIYVTNKAPEYAAGTCLNSLAIQGKNLYLCYNKTRKYQELYQRIIDSVIAK